MELFRLPVAGLIVAALLALSGCPQSRSGPEQSAAPQAVAPDFLKLVVVDDSGMADEIRRRWNAEDRYQLRVEELTSAELAGSGFVLAADVDLVVFPSGLETALVDAGQLIGIPAEVIADDAYNESGLLSHFRGAMSRLSGVQYSLPLGAPQLLWLTSANNLPDPAAAAEPEAAEPGELVWESVEAVLDRPDGEKRLAIPDSGDWLAWCLAARAVSTMRSAGEPAVFFDSATLEPLINTPPFVRALEQLMKLAIPPDPSGERTPAAVFQMVVDGRAAAGMGWPSQQKDPAPAAAAGSGGDTLGESVLALRMPGSRRRFSVRENVWVDRAFGEQFQYELRGMDGRMVGVTTASLHAATALEIAVWLGNPASSLVSVRSASCGPFRKAHLANPEPWLGTSLGLEAVPAWAAAIESSHLSRLPVTFPALLGSGRYLARLSEAVRESLVNGQPAQDSLDAAAADWKKLNEEYGVEKQKGLLKRRSL